MTGSASLVQGLAGDADKAASMLHSLAPEVSLFATCDDVLRGVEPCLETCGTYLGTCSLVVLW